MQILSLVLLSLAPSCALRPPPRVPRHDSWFREAERKHGRVAMLAVPSLAAIALATGDDPVPWLNTQPVPTQIYFDAAAGLLETANLRRIERGFQLKDGEIPGKLLPVANVPPALQSVEDTVGRVAMLLAACAFAASVAT